MLDEIHKVVPEETVGHKNVDERIQPTSSAMSHLTTEGGSVKEHQDKRRQK